MPRASAALKVVHLPVYKDDAYQALMMSALTRQGVECIDGGGGGTFLRTALRRWRADVYHFHWLHPYMLGESWLASLQRTARFLVQVALLRASGARIVWTIHNLASHDGRQRGLQLLSASLFARLTDAVMVHSQAHLNSALQAFRRLPSMREVVPQGSYAGHYPQTLSREQCRSRLGIDGAALTFLFFGRIAAYKGVDELIGCFGKVGSARLLVVGKVIDPATGDRVRAAVKASDRIRHIEGFVSDESVQVYFNAADVYVYPARDVLNSGSVILAMSFGLPCVVPRLPGLAELLSHQPELLYDPETEHGLTEALRRAAQMAPHVLADMGARNREVVQANTWDQSAERIRDLYVRVLGRG